MSDSKKKWIVFAIFISPVLFIAIKGYYQAWQLKKGKGVYIIGKLIASTPQGFHSSTGTYEYMYGGRKYVTSISATPDSFYFFVIDTKKPKEAFPEFNVKVPPCLTLDDVPKEGWKELPLHACDSIK